MPSLVQRLVNHREQCIMHTERMLSSLVNLGYEKIEVNTYRKSDFELTCLPNNQQLYPYLKKFNLAIKTEYFSWMTDFEIYPFIYQIHGFDLEGAYSRYLRALIPKIIQLEKNLSITIEVLKYISRTFPNTNIDIQTDKASIQVYFANDKFKLIIDDFKNNENSVQFYKKDRNDLFYERHFPRINASILKTQVEIIKYIDYYRDSFLSD